MWPNEFWREPVSLNVVQQETKVLAALRTIGLRILKYSSVSHLIVRVFLYNMKG